MAENEVQIQLDIEAKKSSSLRPTTSIERLRRAVRPALRLLCAAPNTTAALTPVPGEATVSSARLRIGRTQPWYREPIPSAASLRASHE